jgi:hypothetical protein
VPAAEPCDPAPPSRERTAADARCRCAPPGWRPRLTAKPCPSAWQGIMTTRTQSPMVTGGSVVALKYAGGILVATDTLASYGSLARFENVSRMATVGVAKDTLLAAGGDYSDYQQMLKIIEQKAVEEYAMDDGSCMSASAMHHWLTRIMYQRRSKMDPLWNAVVIAGVGGDGQSYLGTTDMYGTMYADNFIVSARAPPPHKERARAPLSLPHTARAPLPPTHTHAPARTRMVVAKWARERLRTRQHARVPLGQCWPSTTCSLRLPPPPSFVDLLPPPSSLLLCSRGSLPSARAPDPRSRWRSAALSGAQRLRCVCAGAGAVLEAAVREGDPRVRRQPRLAVPTPAGRQACGEAAARGAARGADRRGEARAISAAG